MNNPHDFDVLLSFAGPERPYARAIFDICTANGVKVFLDEEFQHEIWGQNLVEYLNDTYRERGRYCAILISASYCERSFTRVERRAALDRLIGDASEYVLPVKVDGSWPDGLPLATAFVDLRVIGILGVCQLLVRKVTGSTQALLVPEEVRVPRIPIGRIPADQLSAHLLELCQKQPVVLFGALIYDESTAEYRKLLRDEDYWDALDRVSGPDFEIFALRDEEKWGSNYDRSMVTELVTVASLSRSRDRGYYFSRLLKEYFGEERVSLAYPSLLIFIVSSGQVSHVRLIPLRRGTIEEVFSRLQEVFGLIAKIIAEWRRSDGVDVSVLWSQLKIALLDHDYRVYIQTAPRAVGAAVSGLVNFMEKS